MSNINFGLQNIQPVATSKPRLKPWDIYKVKFAGARIDTIQGKKHPEEQYKILKIRFENEKGYYEESVFFPSRPMDVERFHNKASDGHDYDSPSNFERAMQLVAQIAIIVNPEGFKEMQAKSGAFKSFDDVANYFIRITDPKKDKFETNIKLVGKKRSDNTIEPALPKFLGINKQGEIFVSDNFIGENLVWNSYEEGMIKAFHEAKPTTMADSPLSTINEPTQPVSEDMGDIDWTKIN